MCEALIHDQMKTTHEIFEGELYATCTYIYIYIKILYIIYFIYIIYILYIILYIIYIYILYIYICEYIYIYIYVNIYIYIYIYGQCFEARDHATVDICWLQYIRSFSPLVG